MYPKKQKLRKIPRLLHQSTNQTLTNNLKVNGESIFFRRYGIKQYKSNTLY